MVERNSGSQIQSATQSEKQKDRRAYKQAVRDNQGRVVRKPVNGDPGLNVN